MKRLTLMMILMITVMTNVSAQYFTYNHDATKMNQITIMELGTGAFSPEFYYTLFHRRYKKTAAQKNKMSYRTVAGMTAYNQVDYAELIDSSLVKRSEVEALNVADRKGGALDVAWMAEKDKINKKMESFHNNINRIIPAGGSIDDRNRWDEYYKLFQTAIKAVQNAYMPNSQRKKQYLKIYEDVSRQNEILIKQLVRFSNKGKTREFLTATNSYHVDVKSIAASAYGRWRTVGLTNSSAN